MRLVEIVVCNYSNVHNNHRRMSRLDKKELRKHRLRESIRNSRESVAIFEARGGNTEKRSSGSGRRVTSMGNLGEEKMREEKNGSAKVGKGWRLLRRMKHGMDEVTKKLEAERKGGKKKEDDAKRSYPKG